MLLTFLLVYRRWYSVVACENKDLNPTLIIIRCKIYMIQYNHSVIGKQLHHTKITHGKKVCYDLYISFFCIYRLSCLLCTENASFGKMSICLGLFCSYLQRHQHFIISSYTICFSRTIINTHIIFSVKNFIVRCFHVYINRSRLL